MTGYTMRRRSAKRDAGPRPAMAQRSRRRAIRIGLTGFAAAVLIPLGGWLLQSGAPGRVADSAGRAVDHVMIGAGLTVRDLKLSGRAQAAQADVISALGLHTNQTIFDVDIKAGRERLEEMGWVESARITRRLPSTLEVHIVERLPFALWQVQRRLILVDRDGTPIIRKGLGRFTHLPVVVGDDAPVNAAELIDLLKARPGLLARLDAATRIGHRRWNLRLNNGIDIYLPEEGIARALQRLAVLQRDQKILDREVAVIDLRLADRLVIRMPAEVAERLREPGERT